MEVDESHLKPETPSPVEDRHDFTFVLNPTPNRPTRLSSSLSGRQRLSLLDIDGGICFITGDRLPTMSIQDAHIVQRWFSKEKVRALRWLAKSRLFAPQIKYYEKVWGLKTGKLNVDSRFNRVHRQSF
jgi:hypothetical protein